MTNQRLLEITEWLKKNKLSVHNLIPLAGDASFRRYFRAQTNDNSFIVMDAYPIKESCLAFIAISKELNKLGVHTPTIFAEDIERGLLLLTDFGDTLLNHILQNENADVWYERCFDQLLLIQHHQQLPSHKLTFYNDGLYSYYEESSWFMTWYLQQHLGITLSAKELAELEREIHLVAKIANEQPAVVIHRDYHSRNIMITGPDSLGVLDFQDAVIGPITYDLVSLLRDCYIDWPLERVHHWLRSYYERLRHEQLIQASFDQFLRWFDWAGLQRHLKCAGLFIRLKLRDNKPNYLQYIPRVIHYIRQETEHYPELTLLKELVS